MPLKVAVSDAKAQLTELVRLAESGEEVVLTRFGKDTVRLVPVLARPTMDERRAVLDQVRLAARTHASAGPSAERSQDFLYDKDGLPG